jgi:hypothetical protein
MSLFKKLFGFDKKENTNTRTFKNMERGLNNGYLLDYQIAESAIVRKTKISGRKVSVWCWQTRKKL